jgi:hypothetical protein
MDTTETAIAECTAAVTALTSDYQALLLRAQGQAESEAEPRADLPAATNIVAPTSALSADAQAQMDAYKVLACEAAIARVRACQAKIAFLLTLEGEYMARREQLDATIEALLDRLEADIGADAHAPDEDP